MELVDTSDLKFDSFKSIGSIPVMSNPKIPVKKHMPTINQVCKKKRKLTFKRNKKPALQMCPQKKGVCIKIFLRTPKKPNSAQRKLVRLRLTNEKIISAYIPGEGHKLQEYSTVLIRGGRVKDLPGIKYRLIRGKLDFSGIKGRRNARSKYGTKKESNYL